MIYNPMVVQGGGEPQWQELKLNGTQDVPITRATAEPTSWSSYELVFHSSPPNVILFRQKHTSGTMYYSALLRGNINGEYYTVGGNSPGVKSGSVAYKLNDNNEFVVVVSGSVEEISTFMEFLPIYN